MKLLSLLGLTPATEEMKLASDVRRLVRDLVELDWSELAPVELSGPLSAEIDHFLHGYLIYHLDRVPRGRRAALRTGAGF